MSEGLPLQKNGGTNGQPIMPFMEIQLQLLPSPIRNKFKNEWKPIFKFLENVTKDSVASGDTIDGTYTKCLNHLKTRVSYCFAGTRDPTKYTVSTWSNRTSRSQIVKKGTDSDKAQLGEAGGRNKAKKQGSTRRRKAKSSVLYPGRQQKRRKITEQKRETTNED